MFAYSYEVTTTSDLKSNTWAGSFKRSGGCMGKTNTPGPIRTGMLVVRYPKTSNNHGRRQKYCCTRRQKNDQHRRRLRGCLLDKNLGVHQRRAEKNYRAGRCIYISDSKTSWEIITVWESLGSVHTTNLIMNFHQPSASAGNPGLTGALPCIYLSPHSFARMRRLRFYVICRLGASNVKFAFHNNDRRAADPGTVGGGIEVDD